MSGRPVRLIGTLISAGLLIAIGFWVADQEPPDVPSGSSEIALAVFATIFYALPTWLRSERWRRLLAREGGDPGPLESWRLTLVGYMGNTILPARAGDGLRGYLVVPRSGLSLRTVLGTLVAERLLDVLLMLGVFALLGYWLLEGIDLPGSERFAFWPLAVVAIVFLAGLIFLRSERGRRVRVWVAPVLSSLRNLRGGHGLRIAAVTIAIWVGEVAAWLMLGHATELDPSVSDTLYMVAVTAIFLLLPSGPGFAGTMDAGIIFGVIAIGGSNEAAIGYVLLIRAALQGPPTLGGTYMFLRHYRGLLR